MRLLLILATTAFGAPVIQAATATAPLVLTADTPWIVPASQPEPIRRALEDVQRDWYKVLGHAPIVLTEPPAAWRGPVVYFGLDPAGMKRLLEQPPTERESFVVVARTATDGRRIIVATGADMRGAIYAAYAFSEKILGVDPWHFWTDHEPPPRTELAVPADFVTRAGTPAFKYRGWFLNDEDLLSGFSPDPLRENVLSLEMFDRIYETILRLRGNMIVPATFPFADERCQELASRRGLVLNMHHILVAGLNTWRWPKDVPFSYSRHPEIMERYWKTCIDAFKDKEVVWTVGYRGKNDRAFWKDEPEIATDQARGDVITRAIAKQVELIRAAQPNAPIISNLWLEGADLYHAGLIKLPPGVTLVWPDNGTGLIRDDGKVQPGQGIYYHTAMLSGRANQLTEMVPPARIHHELTRFARAGATEFLLVNVSDVRPVVLSTDCAMKLACDAGHRVEQPDNEFQDAFLLDWCRREFGDKAAAEVAVLYGDYFDIPSHRADVREGDNAPHTYLRQLGQDALPLIRDGKPLSADVLTRVANRLARASANREYIAPLLARAEAQRAAVPAGRRAFFESHLLTALRVLVHSQEMLERYCRALQTLTTGDRASGTKQIEQALVAADELFAALRPGEPGPWSDWYFGESLASLDGTRDLIRTQLALLRGEPPPPLHSRRGYNIMYEYQERFQSNFPLLYGPNAPR